MGWLDGVKKFHNFSADTEGQKAYIRAKQAVDDCRKGNIENFGFIRDIVKKEPFDNMGLEITEDEYKVMEGEYEMWKMGQVKKDEE